MPSTLAYWDIRGLAQPLRLLLKYVGEDFEDKKYVCGEAPEFDKSCWFDIKFDLGLDFPNLPYYISEDGAIKITHTNAIFQYIGRKYNLLGETEQQRVCNDMMLEEAMDFRNGFVRLCYGPDFAVRRDNYVKAVNERLKKYENYLADKEFFAGGKKPTICDFHLYEMFDQHKQLAPEILKDYPKIQAFIPRMEALPAVKTYMASDKFMTAPLNNRMASFGN